MYRIIKKGRPRKRKKGTDDSRIVRRKRHQTTRPQKHPTPKCPGQRPPEHTAKTHQGRAQAPTNGSTTTNPHRPTTKKNKPPAPQKPTPSHTPTHANGEEPDQQTENQTEGKARSPRPGPGPGPHAPSQQEQHDPEGTTPPVPQQGGKQPPMQRRNRNRTPQSPPPGTGPSQTDPSTGT